VVNVTAVRLYPARPASARGDSGSRFDIHRGEDVIAEKTAMVSVGHRQGKVVLIGFRAQTHGTFKLVLMH